MAAQTGATVLRQPKTVFILIGISYYLPGNALLNFAGNHIKFSNLRGAVPDVRAFHRFVLGHPKLKEAEVFTLTSSRPTEGTAFPPEPEDQRPTLHNIVELFNNVTKDTIDGDVIHIHFSCHGVRMKTNYPKLKGVHGIDEAIAPFDIRESGKSLRDVELNILLRRMIKKGGRISLFCDCCHSGSISRGGNDKNDSDWIDSDDDDGGGGGGGGVNTKRRIARGILDICCTKDDENEDTTIQLPQDDNELTEILNQGWKSHDDPLKESWLEAMGYELFASCHLNKTAAENWFKPLKGESGKGEWHGVFTYNLLSILNSEMRTFTYYQLYNKLLSSFRNQKHEQTPVFAGNGSRHFLGTTELNINRSYSLSVIEALRSYVVLSEGEVQAVTIGSTYAIYPWHHTDFSDIDTRPTVEVVDVRPGRSKAIWKQRQPANLTEVGSQAVLIKYKLEKLRIRLSQSKQMEEDAANKFTQLQNHLINDEDGEFIELVHDTDRSVTYHIGLDGADYQLMDWNKKIIPHFPTAEHAQDFLFYLSHLARYQMLKDLVNPSAEKKLQEGYKIKLVGRKETANVVWQSKANCPELRRRIDLDPGKVDITFQNNSEVALHIAIFDFNHWWGVQKIYPRAEDYRTVLAGETKEMRFPLSFPEEWNPEIDCVDHVKIFIVKKGVPFNSVHLENLNKASRGDDEQSLQEYLNLLEIPDRSLGPEESDTEVPWVTEDIQIRTMPPVANKEDEDW